MSTMRAAVIGLGRMGSTFDDEIKTGGSIMLPYCHAPSFVASPLTTLIAGADPHDGQRETFGERWGIDDAHMFTDYREMLEKEKLEIVSVCTTAKIRSQIVVDCAEAGVKAVWAEKPISISLAEADAMVDACNKSGTALAINCARRWNPYFTTARQLIDEGEIGDVLQVTAYAPCGLSHNGSHMLDAIRFLAGGNVEWVFGEMSSAEAAAKEEDPQGNGYLAFDNGARAFARGTSCGCTSWEFEVLGTKGNIRSRNSGVTWEWRQADESLALRRSGTAVKPWPLPNYPEGMGITIVRDIIEAYENGGKPKCSGEDGRAALEIAIALRESHRRGCVKVDLPLEDRELKIFSAETLSGDEPAIVRRQKREGKR
ncbi:MAG: Gfo/Idh/MocA family oxidoreductase [Planctomycetota bacterium]|jgi:predicted dehydrogenase|nr:Gfo/Idh/MocA family oxidoreductase [Planctomycetota bacterium]